MPSPTRIVTARDPKRIPKPPARLAVAREPARATGVAMTAIPSTPVAAAPHDLAAATGAADRVWRIMSGREKEQKIRSR